MLPVWLLRYQRPEPAPSSMPNTIPQIPDSSSDTGRLKPGPTFDVTPRRRIQTLPPPVQTSAVPSRE